MPAAAGEYASDDDSWGGPTDDQPVPDAAVDVIVVVDAGRPTALGWHGLLLPITHAVRWHERPVIPWWRSQRRLDLDQALALVDQERWRLQATIPPPPPALRSALASTEPAKASGHGARHGAGHNAGYNEWFDEEPGDAALDDAALDETEQDGTELDGTELDASEHEPAVVVEVLRAGDDWHVLSIQEP